MRWWASGGRHGSAQAAPSQSSGQHPTLPTLPLFEPPWRVSREHSRRHYTSAESDTSTGSRENLTAAAAASDAGVQATRVQAAGRAQGACCQGLVCLKRQGGGFVGLCRGTASSLGLGAGRRWRHVPPAVAAAALVGLLFQRAWGGVSRAGAYLQPPFTHSAAGKEGGRGAEGVSERCGQPGGGNTAPPP